MRTVVNVLAAAAILCGIASASWAQDPAPKTPPSDVKKVDVKAIAQLQVRLHRTLADLTEANIADSPDKAKIEALTKEVEKLRGELQAQRRVGVKAIAQSQVKLHRTLADLIEAKIAEKPD